MRDVYRELTSLGRVPDERDDIADGVLERFGSVLAGLPPPHDADEAVALAAAMPVHSCFGIEWTLIHFLERAPGWPVLRALERCPYPARRRLADRLEERFVEACVQLAEASDATRPCTQVQIETFEREHDVTLPRDYRQFLHIANGASSRVDEYGLGVEFVPLAGLRAHSASVFDGFAPDPFPGLALVLDHRRSGLGALWLGGTGEFAMMYADEDPESWISDAAWVPFAAWWSPSQTAEICDHVPDEGRSRQGDVDQSRRTEWFARQRHAVTLAPGQASGGVGPLSSSRYPSVHDSSGRAVMAARRADATQSRPRPRPTPHPPAVASPPSPPASTTSDHGVRSANGSSTTGSKATSKPAGRSRNRRKSGRALALPEPTQSGQVVVAAGNAIVTAARVGRLLGRSGWRIAKQLPGVTAVEAQAQKVRHAASAEMFRLLDMPGQMFGNATPEEQRVMMLVHNAGTDPAPLRSAMSELLDRSAEADHDQSRDYLFGTIVSQLVPDEARLLAALGGGRVFAAVDVVSKQVGRGTVRPVLTNASTAGAAAGVALPQNVATYLTRLHGYGLLDFGAADDDLASQYDTLLSDPAVLAAKASVDQGKQGSSKIIRKSVTLSALGTEFWAACAPTKPALQRRSS